MLQPALLALEIHIVKEWDLSNPYLWATTFDVGNIHNALCRGEYIPENLTA